MIRFQLPWRLRQANCCRQERPWNWRPGQASWDLSVPREPRRSKKRNILAKPLRARKVSWSSAYKKHSKSNNVVQPARTAAQIAENARALALGEIGRASC